MKDIVFKSGKITVGDKSAVVKYYKTVDGEIVVGVGPVIKLCRVINASFHSVVRRLGLKKELVSNHYLYMKWTDVRKALAGLNSTRVDVVVLATLVKREDPFLHPESERSQTATAAVATPAKDSLLTSLLLDFYTSGVESGDSIFAFLWSLPYGLSSKGIVECAKQSGMKQTSIDALGANIRMSDMSEFKFSEFAALVEMFDSYRMHKEIPADTETKGSASKSESKEGITSIVIPKEKAASGVTLNFSIKIG